MNKRAKLVRRFRSQPKDFTFEEVIGLFASYGFVLSNEGSTSGSRVEFVNEEKNMSYIIHKPHPSNIIKGYLMRDILHYLESNKLLKD